MQINNINWNILPKGISKEESEPEADRRANRSFREGKNYE